MIQKAEYGTVYEKFWGELKTGLGNQPEERWPLNKFVRESWHVVEPRVEYVHGWHIDAICDHLEAVVDNRIQNLLINMPPRFSKSLIVAVFFPAWVWTFKPEYRMLYTSYSQGLSIRDSIKTRRLIDSDWFQRRWGQLVRFAGDQNKQMRYENTYMGCRIASSVGGSNTGDGGNIVCADDPHNVLEHRSVAKRDSAIIWWDSVMSNRLNDQRKDHKIVVAQRIHEQDLSGHILESSDNWVHLCLPNEYEPEAKCVTPIWEDPREEKGELLCFARIGPDETAELKAVQRDQYWAQYQQNPIAPEGSLFKPEWWKYYDELPEIRQWAQTWDCAFKGTEASSYVVGQVWGFRGAYAYLVDQVREKMSFLQTIEAMKNMTARWPKAILKLIEDKANGPAILNTMTAQGVLGLMPINPVGSKPSRAMATTPLIKAGNVWLPNPNRARWVVDFVEEFSRAREDGTGAYWDQIDAATQLLLLWAETKQTGGYTWGRNE